MKLTGEMKRELVIYYLDVDPKGAIEDVDALADAVDTHGFLAVEKAVEDFLGEMLTSLREGLRNG